MSVLMDRPEGIISVLKGARSMYDIEEILELFMAADEEVKALVLMILRESQQKNGHPGLSQ